MTSIQIIFKFLPSFSCVSAGYIVIKVNGILIRPQEVRVNGNKYVVINFFFKHHLFSESATVAVAIKKKNKVVKTKTKTTLHPLVTTKASVSMCHLMLFDKVRGEI